MKVCVFTFGANTCCGGSVALYKLAKLIRELGIDCRVWAEHGNYHNIPTICNTDDPWFDDQTWVIYPEVIHGNPLNAKHVVRWLLNGVGVIGGDTATWSVLDLIVAYSPSFKSGFDCDIVTAFELFPEHIYPPDEAENVIPRKGVCYCIKKGGHKAMLAETEGATEVYASPTLCGTWFRTSERFISYDTATWLSLQAALCGCLSIVVPDEGITAEEWRSTNTFALYGIAYGFEPDEISRAYRTMPLVKPYLDQLELQSKLQVRNLMSRMKHLLRD